MEKFDEVLRNHFVVIPPYRGHWWDSSKITVLQCGLLGLAVHVPSQFIPAVLHLQYSSGYAAFAVHDYWRIAMATIEQRRTVDGVTTYRAKIRLKGSPAQTASFPRLTDARRWVQATEAAMREGRYFKNSEAKRHTLADAIDRYVREVLPQKANAGAAQATQFEWWRQNLGKYLLSDVTPALVGEWRTKLANEPMAPRSRKPNPCPPARHRSPATLVRYLAALSHLFTVAVREWGWMDDNPVRKVKKPREPLGRERFLDDDERERLLGACKNGDDTPLYTVVVLALSTGMRRGEMMSLRWCQIDFTNQRITLHKTKNGERRSVPLVGLAQELLQQLSRVRRIDNDMLFPGKTAGKPVELKRPWNAALAVAGVANFRFHDLRHSTASYLAMNGATMIEIAAVLGHKTLQMVKRYSHLSDAHTQRVVEGMNRRIFNHG